MAARYEFMRSISDTGMASGPYACERRATRGRHAGCRRHVDMTKTCRRVLLLVPLVAALSGGACSRKNDEARGGAGSAADTSGVTGALRARLTAGDIPEYAADDPDCWRAAQAVYEKGGYQPVWTDE